MVITKEILDKYVEDNLLLVNKHPLYDLFIYNYTQKVQYDNLWDDVTLSCRGLIIDNNSNIIARPYNKFFNYEENKHIPTNDFKIYDKADGSLIILFYYDNKWICASRGSFMSEQSQVAEELLNNYNTNILNKNCTYLFEVIYPSNRIVVDYGDYKGLIMHGKIETSTDVEHDVQPYKEHGFDVIKIYDFNDYKILTELDWNNHEGFVIKFNNGDRCKIKLKEYIRLHKIITNISSIDIWEYLKEEKDFNELLEKVPDEFYNWVKETEEDLRTKFNNIKEENEKIFWSLINRKEFALKAKETNNPNLLFTRLNSYSKNLDTQIWEMIRPTYSKPFSNKNEY